MANFFFSEERPGEATWTAELFHVRVVDGILEAESFDPDRGVWDDVHVSEIDDICEGRTQTSDPLLVEMVLAAEAYIVEQEAS
ncbi:hypothetical protein ACT17_22880 [Mycolicibacterium conceptionense]|uniref:Uncharacterized protein n=1 Tax=Mycolicibacterium conceptionense TaxID=451644 RepID=A0A0J8U339_9MYCO|nr:hypothetical protein [Mycolicibacterium conceptionense]KMV15941.1 hypothetical protein ACT17_22880 [Mycolicibacterium conceptionense]